MPNCINIYYLSEFESENMLKLKKIPIFKQKNDHFTNIRLNSIIPK